MQICTHQVEVAGQDDFRVSSFATGPNSDTGQIDQHPYLGPTANAYKSLTEGSRTPLTHFITHACLWLSPAVGPKRSRSTPAETTRRRSFMRRVPEVRLADVTAALAS